jgi:hypothetical protein
MPVVMGVEQINVGLVNEGELITCFGNFYHYKIITISLILVMPLGVCDSDFSIIS